jgi:hypothetical protein
MLDLAQKNLAVPSASSETQVANDFPEFTDLYLPECNPEYGVYYPGPSALSPEMGLLAKELVEVAIKRGVDTRCKQLAVRISTFGECQRKFGHWMIAELKAQ